MNPTRTIAEFVVDARDLPAVAINEATRTLVNILAVSISASEHASSKRLVEWARAEGAAPRSTIIGSDLRTSPTIAAELNGFLAHLQDYDDTHFPTVLHPSAPVWPAVLAAAEERGASGRDTLTAFALGEEVACRIASSVHPWHYDAGWHITGTVGVLGAAAGAGRLLGLDAGAMVNALGLSGTQASGVREVFGTDGKAWHAAKAASNGYQSAALAAMGMNAAPDILDGRRGFWAVLSPNGHEASRLTDHLGTHWELTQNGLKPYANGVVSHPIQDAVIALRNEHALTPDIVAKIEARVCPLVLELMNRAEPHTGLEGKFSFQHCAAAALVDGAGHDAQFTDARVNDPVIAAVRSRVSATVDATIPEHEVFVTITLTDGRQVSKHIEHASGSPANPLSDAVLDTKFRDLVEPVYGAVRAAELLDVARNLEDATSITPLLRLIAR